MGPEFRDFCPGMRYHPSGDVLTHLEAPRTPFLDSMELPHIGTRHHYHLQPSPLQEDEGEVGSSQFLIMSWSFCGPAPSRSSPRASSLEAKAL